MGAIKRRTSRGKAGEGATLRVAGSVGGIVAGRVASRVGSDVAGSAADGFAAADGVAGDAAGGSAGRGASAERSVVANVASSTAAWAHGPATFTARLVALDERGRAWLQSLDAPASGRRAGTPARAARSTVALSAAHVGREVLVCRANLEGELVIVGVLVEPRLAGAAGEPGVEAAESLDLVIERRRVVLSARTEVVLRCGEGSITLAANGKVTISGVDVVSSAARTQRIRGGAVRIN